MKSDTSGVTTHDFEPAGELSPTGRGPTVQIGEDFSWHEHFVIPGDLSSDVKVSHGSFIRVFGLSAIGADSGTFKADGTFRGHAGEDVSAEDPAVCRLLLGG